MNRDRIGRFVSNLWVRTLRWVMRWLLRSAVVCSLGWVFFAGYMYNEFDTVRTAYAANFTGDIVMQGLDIEGIKDRIIGELARRENDGGVPCYPDDNSRGSLPKKDKVSCGDMAYKVSTVQRHAKGCYGEDLSNEEAVALALDDVRSRALAKCAIFGEQNAINEWMAATPKMKLEVEIIRGWSK